MRPILISKSYPIGQSQNPKPMTSTHPCGSPLRFGTKKSTINQQSKLHQIWTGKNRWAKSPRKSTGKRHRAKEHRAKEHREPHQAKDRAKITGESARVWARERERHVYIYIDIHIYAVESKLGPKLAFFESKLGPFFFVVLIFQVLTQPWTKFWLNLLGILEPFSFYKRCWNHYFIVLSPRNWNFLAHPKQLRNTICEHNCANWKMFLSVFFALLFLFFFAVSGFWGVFSLRGMKKNNKKTIKTKKKGSRTTRRKQEKPLSHVTKKDNTETKW